MKKVYFIKSLLSIVMAATMSMGLSSCSEDDEVSVSNANVTINAGETSETISISSNTNWVANADSTWCTISPSAGSGNGTISVTLAPNYTDKDRECKVMVYAGDASCTFIVRQEHLELSVSPAEIYLLKEANSSASITITSKGKWAAECHADWLNLSSKSGEGKTIVNITALSDNDSASEREAIITVKSEGLSKVVKVIQRPIHIRAFANADIDNAVILSNSYAIKMTYDGDVSYYYAAILSKSSSAGWTDKKVVSEITSKFNPEKPSDEGEDMFYNSGFSANTTYIFFTVAFNEKGEQGPLQRFEFTTPRRITNRPGVSYANLRADSQWHWTTVKNAFAKRYYMIALDGLYAFAFGNYPDAAAAFAIREGANSGSLSPIVDSGSWNLDKETDYFYSACWAQGDDGKFASEIDKVYIDPSSFSRGMRDIQDHAVASQSGKVSMKELREILSHAKVYAE